jgi:hypothetical protein
LRCACIELRFSKLKRRGTVRILGVGGERAVLNSAIGWRADDLFHLVLGLLRPDAPGHTDEQ